MVDVLALLVSVAGVILQRQELATASKDGYSTDEFVEVLIELHSLGSRWLRAVRHTNGRLQEWREYEMSGRTTRLTADNRTLAVSTRGAFGRPRDPSRLRDFLDVYAPSIATELEELTHQREAVLNGLVDDARAIYRLDESEFKRVHSQLINQQDQLETLLFRVRTLINQLRPIGSE